MKAGAKFLIAGLCLSLVVAGCETVPEKPEGRTVLSAQVKEAVSIFKAEDPSIQRFFDKSYGYAVLPKIFKVAFWIGGAGGRGEVYEKGKMIGYCKLSGASLGFSFGGEFFREIIFFRDGPDLDKFRVNELTFSAQATGVVLTAGAAAKTDYKDGMAVFVLTDKGLMLDVSLAGQHFDYFPGY